MPGGSQALRPEANFSSLGNKIRYCFTALYALVMDRLLDGGAINAQ
jgi:hypothetical protein